ncbi:hypothetical protein PC113_g7535 [Phytophthora cactorum]|uniref:Uncharacterized protein n=1 Tax=Phytophthora cactorum TaxID=29920 RepID=A0A8T0ZFH5_9STRA|nr:hypothetical protein PC113_g7535 [Phytophthora cactorum]
MDTSGEQKVFVPSTVFYLSLAVQNTDNNFCGRGEDDALVFFTVMMALLAVDELRCARDGCRAALPPKSWTRIDLLRAFAWRSCAVSCPAFCGGTDLEGCLSKTAAVVAASRSAYRTMIADLKHLWAPTNEDAECIAHLVSGMHIPQHSTTSWRITTRSSRRTKTTRTAYSQVERGQHAPSKKIVYPVKNRQVGAWHPAAQHIANSANLNPEPRAACVFAFECIPRAEKAFTVARSGLGMLVVCLSPFQT